MVDLGTNKTPIDILISLLEEKKKMELNDIVTALNVNPTIVESWIKILEDNNAVKVTYEFGKMYVELQKVSKESEKSQKIQTIEKETDLKNKIINKKIDVESYIAKYGQMSEAIREAEQQFQQKFSDVEKQLDAINKVYSMLNEEDKYFNNLSKNIELLYNSTTKKIDYLQSKITSIDAETINAADNKVLKMRSIISDANKIEGEIELISKSKDNAVNFIKKGIKEQFAMLEKDIAKVKTNINSEIAIYRDQLEDNLKEIKEKERDIEFLHKELVSFKNESKSLNNELNKMKVQFNNSYTKINDYIISHNVPLKQDIEKLTNEINKTKERFGDISKLYDNIKDNKNKVVNFKEEIYQIKAEYDKIFNALKNLQDEKNIEAKQINIAKINMKIEDLNNKLDNLNKKYFDILI
ncbi:MAG: hypothetical protein M1538_03410 [Candidatus Marsarchaeota archaeon]|jgi:chromosome segregation ATPase|nr:hypothetical protein [Candidatus Marsarchaeota archaeon]